MMKEVPITRGDLSKKHKTNDTHISFVALEPNQCNHSSNIKNKKRKQ